MAMRMYQGKFRHAECGERRAMMPQLCVSLIGLKKESRHVMRGEARCSRGCGEGSAACPHVSERA